MSYRPFIPNDTPDAVEKMIKKLGISSVEELFSDIPENVRIRQRLSIPDACDEYTLRREVDGRLGSNITFPVALCFLGGGVYPHYVPSVVDSIVSRQEFYTSYTPYQPEISQGMLQALFEYQSLMCDLLKMEACNSSMYDWASSAAEAVRMAVRVNNRKKVLIASNVSERRKKVISSYCSPVGIELGYVNFVRKSGEVDLNELEKKLDNETSAFYFENPNYFGVIEQNSREIVEALHRNGSLAIVGVDPISLSLIIPPGDYNADIVVGEGQPLGLHMNYGGPHLGIFAVREKKLVRSMPGRLIGMTTTEDGKQRAFTMVLQTREQHIRRENATSNICTNQALMALASACYLSLLGKNGLRKLGETIISNSHYAFKRLREIKGVTSVFDSFFFKEFVLGYESKDSEFVFNELAKKKIFAGLPLEKSYGLGSSGLYCVTEVHGYDDIEKLARALEELL